MRDREPQDPWKRQAMQLGFVSAILPDLSLEEVLRFASDEGYDCVEVMCWPKGRADRRYAGVTHLDCAGFDAQEAADVKALCHKLRVSLSGLGYYPNVLCADPAEAEVYIQHLRKVIDAASLLGLDRVNTFIGADPALNVERNFARFETVWPAIIRHGEERGVRIGIENCPMLFSWDEWPGGKNLAYSPSIWRRMFQRIPSRSFGLNYDPSHLVWQMIDYVKPLAEFKDRLFHVHAKDMRIERDLLDDRGILGLGWSTPKVPGLGEVDWGRFIAALTDVGYDGPVCVEVEDRAFEHSLEGRKRSLRLSRNVLRPLIV
jgi:sugar phosphate isomerase/epimerase